MRILLGLFFVAFAVATAASQEVGSWAQMAKKDAEKLLSQSPWGQTQTETDTSEMFFSPTRAGTSSVAQVFGSNSKSNPNNQQTAINNNRADEGAKNQAISINYHVRLLSAKPIREGISRLVMLGSNEPPESVAALMQTFVDRDFGNYIVLSVTFDSSDGRLSGPAVQAFATATADTLKNKTYLERKDGKRLFLLDYRSPQADGLGAKFVFEREPGGMPFVTADCGSFRFYSEVDSKIKLNVKFVVSDLMYRGVLEY